MSVRATHGGLPSTATLVQSLRSIGWFAAAGALVLNPNQTIQAQQVTLAAQAQTNATVFREQVGRRLTFVCPANVQINQDIYGTDNYTDTSPICTAAAHAGVFTKGTSAAVTIVMEGRKESFTASNRNKIQSLSYGPWSGTYSFVRTNQPGQIDWNTTIAAVDKDYLTPINLVCPRAQADRGEIWGTDVYPEDSAICVAAVHAGAITLEGGTVTLTRVEKQASFPSTTRHEITSRMWSDPAWRSYPQPYRVAPTVQAAAPTINAVLVQPTPVTGTATPMTQATATATAPIGATAGPIASERNPVANKDLFGPPPPRTILLSRFSAAGRLQPIARKIGLPTFTAAGGSGAVLSRSIPLPRFNATGVAPPSTAAAIAPRTVYLSAYSASGRATAIVSRKIALPAYTSVGSPGVPSRTIKLPSFIAVGIP